MKAILCLLLFTFTVSFWLGLYFAMEGPEARPVKPALLYQAPGPEQRVTLEPLPDLAALPPAPRDGDPGQAEERGAWKALRPYEPTPPEPPFDPDLVVGPMGGMARRAYQPKPPKDELEDLLEQALARRAEIEKDMTPEEIATIAVDELARAKYEETGILPELWEREALIGCALADWQGETQDEAWARIVKR